MTATAGSGSAETATRRSVLGPSESEPNGLRRKGQQLAARGRRPTALEVGMELRRPLDSGELRQRRRSDRGTSDRPDQDAGPYPRARGDGRRPCGHRPTAWWARWEDGADR
jgi:hypothetical protein